MIDIELVKLKYARMEEEELIYLTEHSSYGLSTEAISALYQEFLKRNLDTSIFSNLRARVWQIHNYKLQKNKEILHHRYQEIGRAHV